MTLLKALLPLAALLLLSVVPTETKVVHSIAECNEFLLNNNPPNIPGILEGGKIKEKDKDRYKPICQTFNNNRTFVTLYDTKNKIPVFSAAKYRGSHKGERPKTKWMIDPQLEKRAGNDNMTPAKDKKTYNQQAGLPDYKEVLKQDFNKGHLFPSSYGFNEDEMRSTFTLTNTVPQNINFNSKSWNNMEQCIKCVMDKYCINNDKIEGFVVIGAQPSTDEPRNDRVNIPSMLWSAFCCYISDQDRWLASAHWGNNTEPKDKYLQTKTLDQLHKKLGGNSEVFPGSKCPLNENVDKFYPKLDPNCNCPK